MTEEPATPQAPRPLDPKVHHTSIGFMAELKFSLAPRKPEPKPEAE